MKLADVYLRKGKVFAVGLKGKSIFVEDSSPRAADAADLEAVTEVIQGALGASVVPSPLPPNLRAFRSALPGLAGVKTESAFNRGASLCGIRQLDDRIELLPGVLLDGGAWRQRVADKLPLETTPSELTAAVLRLLNQRT